MNSEHSLPRKTAQFALAGLILLLFCSLSTTVAYTVGRLKGAQASNRPEEKPMVPLIIDPVAQPAPARPRLPVAQPPIAQPPVAQLPVAQPPVAQPAPVPRPAPAPPAIFYFQVGSLEKGMAEACKHYLEAKAFRVKVTPSTEPNAHRVLVGPLAAGQEVAATRAALESLGFRVFLRHY